jgi:hypothetical protein
MDGSLVATAWTVSEFLDLDLPPDHAGVVRTLGYVLARQNAPGHFGEGCDPSRHDAGLCRHYLSGFFSAATRDEDVAPLPFPSGITLSDEEGARFAASCFALRVALRAGEDRREPIRRHLESLLDLRGMWETWGSGWDPNLTLFALSALAQAPIDLRDRVRTAVAHVLAHQQPDGSWPGADLFHAVDTLLSVHSPEARAAVRRAAPLLAMEQRPSGAFDDADNEERALVALRALRTAVDAA